MQAINPSRAYNALIYKAIYYGSAFALISIDPYEQAN